MVLRLTEGGVEGDSLLKERYSLFRLAHAGQQGAKRVLERRGVRCGFDGAGKQIGGGGGFAG